MYIYALLALLAFVVFVIVRLCFKFGTRWNNSYTCLVGKTAIITGSNTGIGYWTALDFAKRGARVILACRNEEKANEARDKIIKETGNTNVVYRYVDFTSLRTVREFCNKINETEERLDILVNNAGALNLGDKLTEDGLQIFWQVNHFSAFLLTHLLLDKLEKSAPSRIIMVSSRMAQFTSLSLNQVNTFDKSLDVRNLYQMNTYGFTKIANALFARELARRAPPGVNTYALHPGIITTDIWNTYEGVPRIIYACMYGLIYMKSSEEGAQTTIYCSVSKDLENKSGRFYANCQEISMYSSCLDMDLAEKVFDKCEELVGLREDEKIKRHN